MEWLKKIFKSLLSRFKGKKRKLTPRERARLIESLRKKRKKNRYF